MLNLDQAYCRRRKIRAPLQRIAAVEVSRDTSDTGNTLSQEYAQKELYEKDAEVYVLADGKFETESQGGSYGPASECNSRGCFGKDDILKAIARANSFKVVGPSKFGSELVIEYSARGFTRAFQRLNSECARGQIGTWLR